LRTMQKEDAAIPNPDAVWSKYVNCRRDKKVISLPVASSSIVRYHFVGIEGAHCGSLGGGGELLEWARILRKSGGRGDDEGVDDRNPKISVSV
jgi:hypothetical protein